MQGLLPYVINGISAGGQYALIAIGYTLVYGILRLINFAHGDVFMVAGLIMVYASASLPMYLAIPLVHAVMDALLGAAALGDIGKLFPDNDDAYLGADSVELLKKVRDVLQEHGWKPGNLDATVIAQRPKLAPYIDTMRKRIADALETDAENVSVKATTEERLGFTGSGEGIAAHAVCLIERV